MARPIRIEYPGAVYHVMARGNQGRPIFRDDDDRRRFLETLAEAHTKTGWRIHAYVLMGNHYHLLLETPEGNLVAGMKWLQGTYTRRYNSRHRVFGHLFQGRYKAVVVDARQGDYLQVVSTYIHLNPARAGLIEIGRERLKRYRWSSYPWYLNRAAKGPRWLCRERVMGSLGFGRLEGKGYEAYIESRVLELASKTGRKDLEEQWTELRRGWFLGGKGFAEKLQARLEHALQGRKRESHSGAAKGAHDQAAAEEQLVRAMEILGLSLESLDQLPKGAPEKVALAWWLRERTTVSLRWVAERLRMGHYSRVTQAVSRMKRRPGRRVQQIQRRIVKLEAKREK
ncbi:MAG: transposase [Verrucomicrobiota bacterium]|jgi:REP element-mobilizing transposase RayT